MRRLAGTLLPLWPRRVTLRITEEQVARLPVPERSQRTAAHLFSPAASVPSLEYLMQIDFESIWSVRLSDHGRVDLASACMMNPACRFEAGIIHVCPQGFSSPYRSRTSQRHRSAESVCMSVLSMQPYQAVSHYLSPSWHVEKPYLSHPSPHNYLPPSFAHYSRWKT